MFITTEPFTVEVLSKPHLETGMGSHVAQAGFKFPMQLRMILKFWFIFCLHLIERCDYRRVPSCLAYARVEINPGFCAR